MAKLTRIVLPQQITVKANFPMASKKITDLADPTNNQDAVNKRFLLNYASRMVVNTQFGKEVLDYISATRWQIKGLSASSDIIANTDNVYWNGALQAKGAGSDYTILENSQEMFVIFTATMGRTASDTGIISYIKV